MHVLWNAGADKNSPDKKMKNISQMMTANRANIKIKTRIYI